MSTTNPTFLNGNAVSAEDKVVLSNGDKIHISERSFIFQNGRDRMLHVLDLNRVLFKNNMFNLNSKEKLLCLNIRKKLTISLS